MKIDRLFGIVTMLLEHERVQAKELARRYEVSVRTIYRDIEALERAGVPVVTFPGSGGGLGILPGYKLDRRFLSRQDLAAISAGLSGLSSISGDDVLKTVLGKLAPETASALTLENDIIIDFSDWNDSTHLLQQIAALREAIALRRCIRMEYISASGPSSRMVEPCKVVFKSNSWYLYAYCRMREEFRLFKLRRIRAMELSAEGFQPRPLESMDLRWEDDYISDQGEKIVLRFPATQEFLVLDIFGEEGYTREADGSLLAAFHSTDLAQALNMILGLGPEVEVVESETLKGLFVQWAENIFLRYQPKE